MSTCATSNGRRGEAPSRRRPARLPRVAPARWRAACGALVGVLAGAVAAGAEEAELDFDGLLVPGVRFYSLSEPGSIDGLTGYFDQYRYVHDKDAGPPTHVDLLELQLGWYREDGTPFVRVERRSPHRLAERGQALVDHDRVGLRLDYHRFRTDALRIFPEATGDPGADAPGYAEQFFADTPVGEPLGVGSRFYTQRAGVGGEVGLRLEDVGLDNPVLRALSVGAAFDRRQGARQDRFLLDPGFEASDERAWRAWRRPFEQDVVDVHGQLVLEPKGWFTGVVDVGYEAFRENEEVISLANLAGEPAVEMPIAIPAGTSARRAIHFVPDTDQVEASLRLSRRLRGTHLQAAGSVVHLAQAGRSPLARERGLGTAELTLYAAQASFAAALGDWLPLDGALAGWGDRLGLSGQVSLAHRENGIDRDLYGVATVGDAVNFRIAERTEVNGELEATLALGRGAELGAGYRVRSVERTLEDPTDGTTPFVVGEVNFLEEESLRHTAFGRGRVRLAHGIRLSGELGYETAPEVGLPRELEEVVYAEGRAEGRNDTFLPVSLSATARVRSGLSDGVAVQDVGGRIDKDFDRLDWRYALQLSAQPLEGTTAFASFSHHRDEQEFAFLRTSNGRTVSPFLPVDFFLDSRPELRADTRSLVLGGSQSLLERVRLSGSLAFTWVEVDYVGGSPTEALLQANAAIDQKILSAEVLASFAPGERAELLLGYRYDRFSDGLDLQPLGLDEAAHTVTLAVRIPLDRVDED